MKEKKNKTSVYFEQGYRYMELDEFQNAINEFDKCFNFDFIDEIYSFDKSTVLIMLH